MTAELRSALQRAVNKPGRGSSDFDLNRDTVLPEGRTLRPAAVLIGVTTDGDVILTKRASHLRHHPGQIAFPGGRKDDTDTTLVATALRETQEEVGLDPAGIEVLGALPGHETVTGYHVTPIVGFVRDRSKMRPEKGEVSEIFHVPIDHVTDPTRFGVESRLWLGRRRFYFVVPYGPYYVWGATARILRGLAERMTS